MRAKTSVKLVNEASNFYRDRITAKFRLDSIKYYAEENGALIPEIRSMFSTIKTISGYFPGHEMEALKAVEGAYGTSVAGLGRSLGKDTHPDILLKLVAKKIEENPKRDLKELYSEVEQAFTQDRFNKRIKKTVHKNGS